MQDALPSKVKTFAKAKAGMSRQFPVSPLRAKRVLAAFVQYMAVLEGRHVRWILSDSACRRGSPYMGLPGVPVAD
jgi:hypothetical protein